MYYDDEPMTAHPKGIYVKEESHSREIKGEELCIAWHERLKHGLLPVEMPLSSLDITIIKVVR